MIKKILAEAFRNIISLSMLSKIKLKLKLALIIK